MKREKNCDVGIQIHTNTDAPKRRVHKTPLVRERRNYNVLLCVEKKEKKFMTYFTVRTVYSLSVGALVRHHSLERERIRVFYCELKREKRIHGLHVHVLYA